MPFGEHHGEGQQTQGLQRGEVIGDCHNLHAFPSRYCSGSWLEAGDHTKAHSAGGISVLICCQRTCQRTCHVLAVTDIDV